MTSILQQLNQELSALTTTALNTVVQIRDERGGAGAGTIWHPEGLIVTNAHVVRRGPVQVALFDGRVLPARVLARDDMHDLAALSIDASGLPVIEPGSTAALRPGQYVVALGHPWGVTNAVTGGVVTGVGKPIAELPGSGPDWVLVDLKLRPGNSGGPLVDMQGRIVGVNTIMTGREGGAAVGVDTVKAFLRRSIGGITPREIV